MKYDDIIAVIKSGLEIIKAEQCDDGGFITLSSSNPEGFHGDLSYKTVFAAANILDCLNTANKLLPMAIEGLENLKEICRHIVDFLIAQKSDCWSFNYWSKTSKERETMPYPDDLDDTFRVLTAIYDFDATLIGGDVLAMVAKSLIKTEVEPGGPYRTWLAFGDVGAGWRDVDIVVNSAIGSFLSRLDIKTPKLERFIERKIQEDQLTSPYYPGVCHAAYFVSRFYHGPEKAKVVGKIFEERGESGVWANQIETAMALWALINLSFKESVSEDDIQRLVKDIQVNGFQAGAFCMDPSRDGKKYYAGSKAVTAAFVVGLLSNWLDAKKEDKMAAVIKRSDVSKKEGGRKLLAQIKAHAVRECKNTPKSLKILATEYIEKINDAEIVLVPYRMRNALGHYPKDHTIDKGILELLALGNLYGWMAYCIYDDLLDGDGNPRLLPAANFFLRQLIYLYRELGCVIWNFDHWCEQLMNGSDDANIWEIEHARWAVCVGEPPTVPKVIDEELENRFAARSLAHSLPALGVLLNFLDYTDYKHPERDIKALLSFFRHYLIARQLHDDAHDWSDDLIRGRMTPVLAKLLRKYQAKYPDKEIDLRGDIADLRRFFWREEIQEVVYDIETNIEKARSALGRVRAVKNPEALASLLNPLAHAAIQTLQEREQTLKFLEEYTSPQATNERLWR